MIYALRAIERRNEWPLCGFAARRGLISMLCLLWSALGRFGGQGIIMTLFLGPPALDIAVDASGNSYVTGSFAGNDGSSLVIGSTLLGAQTGVIGGFVFKLNPAGMPLWAKRWVTRMHITILQRPKGRRLHQRYIFDDLPKKGA